MEISLCIKERECRAWSNSPNLYRSGTELLCLLLSQFSCAKVYVWWMIFIKMMLRMRSSRKNQLQMIDRYMFGIFLFCFFFWVISKNKDGAVDFGCAFMFTGGIRTSCRPLLEQYVYTSCSHSIDLWHGDWFAWTPSFRLLTWGSITTNGETFKLVWVFVHSIVSVDATNSV